MSECQCGGRTYVKRGCEDFFCVAQTVNPEESVGRLPEQQQNTRPLLFRGIPVRELRARLC